MTKPNDFPFNKGRYISMPAASSGRAEGLAILTGILTWLVVMSLLAAIVH